MPSRWRRAGVAGGGLFFLSDALLRGGQALVTANSAGESTSLGACKPCVCWERRQST